MRCGKRADKGVLHFAKCRHVPQGARHALLTFDVVFVTVQVHEELVRCTLLSAVEKFSQTPAKVRPRSPWDEQSITAPMCFFV